MFGKIFETLLRLVNAELIREMEIMSHIPLPIVQKARIARDPRFDGLFFIGVKTTGIFCRPICKARMPLEKNVTYYNSAITAMNAGCRAIVGQQVTVKAAIGQLNLLQNTLSKIKGSGSLNPIKGSGSLNPNPLIPFVTAKQVAEADLSFMKIPNARKKTLKAFAQFMLEKPEADIKQWLNIKGIGPWTVNYVTMRNSDSPDIFLATDLVVKNQLKQLADSQVFVQPELAAPWRSYLTLILWNLSQSNAATYKPATQTKKEAQYE